MVIAKPSTADFQPVPLWHKLQAQFYIDVPTVKIGAGYTTFGASKRMSGYYPGIWPAFWNTTLTT